MVGLRHQVVERTISENGPIRPARPDEGVTPLCHSLAVEPRDARVQLAGTIEREVIPRLVLAQRTEVVPLGFRACDAIAPTPTVADIAEFSRIVLAAGHREAVRYIDAHRTGGMSLEAVYLDLLAPTARHLGHLWDQDLCHFADVTMGLCRLQRVVRELSPEFMSSHPHSGLGCQVLLSPVESEHHTFGLLMVAEFLSRAGWIVTLAPTGSRREVVGLVRNHWFGLVGFSLSCDSRIDEVAGMIRAVRRASRNRSIRVLVGGRVFAEHADLVRHVGADATAADGRQVAAQARNVLNLLPVR